MAYIAPGGTAERWLSICQDITVKSHRWCFMHVPCVKHSSLKLFDFSEFHSQLFLILTSPLRETTELLKGWFIRYCEIPLFQHTNQHTTHQRCLFFKKQITIMKLCSKLACKNRIIFKTVLKTVDLAMLYFIVIRTHLHFYLLAFSHFFVFDFYEICAPFLYTFPFACYIFHLLKAIDWWPEADVFNIFNQGTFFCFNRIIFIC